MAQQVTPDQHQHDNSETNEKQNDARVQDQPPGGTSLSRLGLPEITTSTDGRIAVHRRQSLSLEYDPADYGEQYCDKDYYGNGVKHFEVRFFDIHDQVLLGCDNDKPEICLL